MTDNNDATTKTYLSLARAFKHFNKELFDGKLPDAIITFRHHKDSIGTFYNSRFYAMDGTKRMLDEIALNAGYFSRGPKLTLSTLVHEMAHLWQQHLGKCGKGGYHNKQWANKMEVLGLMPSSTAAVGGKRTGTKVSHYIIAGGAFEVSCDRLLASDEGFSLLWGSYAEIKGTKPAKQKKPRAKTVLYTCPHCGLKARSAEGASIECADCEELMLPPDAA